MPLTAPITNARIVLGPLTTTFHPPTSCSVFVSLPIVSESATAFRGLTCDEHGYPLENSDCWPATTAASHAGPPLYAFGVYSPGLDCPAGLATACTEIADVPVSSVPLDDDPAATKTFAPIISPTSFAFNFPPTASAETAVGCCPTGFQCGYRRGVQVCHSRLSAGTQPTFAVGGCAGPALALNPREALPSGGMDLYAPVVQLHFRPSDLLLTRTIDGGGAAATTTLNPLSFETKRRDSTSTATASPSTTPLTSLDPATTFLSAPVPSQPIAQAASGTATAPFSTDTCEQVMARPVSFSPPPGVIVLMTVVPVVVVAFSMLVVVFRSRRRAREERDRLGFTPPTPGFTNVRAVSWLRDWPGSPAMAARGEGARLVGGGKMGPLGVLAGYRRGSETSDSSGGSSRRGSWFR